MHLLVLGTLGTTNATAGLSGNKSWRPSIADALREHAICLYPASSPTNKCPCVAMVNNASNIQKIDELN